MPTSEIKSLKSEIAPQAILLAAGQGKRMGSDLPKVLLEVAGKPMLHWVIQACRDAGVTRCVIVIGYKGELVREAFADYPDCVFVEQTEQLGTGHAAKVTGPVFADQPACDTFVLAGDGPLIHSQTLQTVLKTHRDTAAAATLATSVIDDPTGYGRVLRDTDNRFDRIVEQKDATPDQLTVREVNPSYYCFRSDALFSTLENITSDNAQGEYYLTDVPGILKASGQTVSLVDAVPPRDVLSINTPEQLAEVDRLLRERLASAKPATPQPAGETP